MRGGAVRVNEFVHASVGEKVVIRLHMDRTVTYGRWLTVIHSQDAAGTWVGLSARRPPAAGVGARGAVAADCHPAWRPVLTPPLGASK